MTSSALLTAGAAYHATTKMPGTSNVTMTCFFTITASDSVGTTLLNTTWSTNSIMWQIFYTQDSLGNIFSSINWTDTVSASGNYYNTNQWYFGAMVGNTSGGKWYTKPVGNNVLTLDVSITGTSTTHPVTSIDIGCDATNQSFYSWLGCICGVKYWSNTNLSLFELELESRQIEPVRTADLFGFWPLTSDIDVFDRTSRGNTLTSVVPADVTQTGGPPIPYSRYTKTDLIKSIF